MLKKLKPGAGRYLGDDYQIWIGVLIILEWFSKDTDDFGEKIWLRQEIGVAKYGIFDDIQAFTNDKYNFYQTKSSPKNSGGYIDENTIMDPTDGLYIKKIYSSYSKIKRLIDSLDFKLIICHDRIIINKLAKCIDQNRFSNSVINNSAKDIDKTEIRRILFEECESPPDFNDFLTHIFFQKINNPKEQVIHLSNNREDIYNFLYNIVKNNALFEFDGDSKKIFYSNVKLFLNNPNDNIDLFPQCWFVEDWFNSYDILNHKREKIKNLGVEKIIMNNYAKGPNIELIKKDNTIIHCFLIIPKTNQKYVDLIQLWIGENIEHIRKDINFRIIKNTEDNRFIRQFPEDVVI
ncbi:hypothetical protein LCGC14_2457650 [marine sediment metagenome]|uniref:Uncharacterized protein n=1 Tax=marine sediment metagenome TaxID=412755 RepID=A0A0F9E852_9ZZZZ